MVLDVSTGRFGSGSDSGECRGEEGVVLVVRQEGSGALRVEAEQKFFKGEKRLRWGQQGQMTAREEVTPEGTWRTSGMNMEAVFK